MPSDRIPVRTGRGLAAAGLALLAALLLAGAARADTAQVTVVSPGGNEQTLALEAMSGSEDVVDRPYVLRGADGETTKAVTGFSLAKLIEAADADPYSFSYLEVQRPGGGAVTLSRDQALGADSFADGPPVVYATAAGTGFLRPAASAEDLNAGDSFEAPQGIALVLRKGMALQVRAEASKTKVEKGQAVEFSAVVVRAGSGERLTYSWNFDDGGTAKGERASHKFTKPGSYDVVLGVTAAGNEAGASAVVTIQVGDPIAGPERKGGGRNETKDAPDHGAAAGPSAGGGSGGTGTPAYSPPAAAASSPAPAPPAPETAAAADPVPAGEEVSGELLSAPASGGDPQPQAEARRGNLSGESAAGSGVPAAAWGGLATLGLLGLGGLLEARGLGGLLPGRRGGLA